jgi:hypothetical protein
MICVLGEIVYGKVSPHTFGFLGGYKFGGNGKLKAYMDLEIP